MFRKLGRYALCLSCTLSFCQFFELGTVPAYSQTTTTTPRPAPTKTLRQNLTAVPGNLGLPMPPDAVFVNGYEARYENSQRRTTILRVTSKNGGQALFDWYQRSLESRGWQCKPRRAPRNSFALNGTKDNSTLIVNVLAGASPQAPSTLMITIDR